MRRCIRSVRRVMVSAVATMLVSVAVLGTVWFVGMRTKWRPVIDFQRRVNRTVLNPRQMATAGQPGAYAGVIRHVGRYSGRSYETPVVPFRTGDGFVIVLPYGTRPDWVRNVLATDEAELVHEGETFAVGSPLVREVQPGDVPAKEERAMRLFGNTECMVLRSR